MRHQPKSILAAPVESQTKLSGVVYLENNETKAAFTQERVQVLQILCSQAAISIANAPDPGI